MRRDGDGPIRKRTNNLFIYIFCTQTKFAPCNRVLLKSISYSMHFLHFRETSGSLSLHYPNKSSLKIHNGFQCDPLQYYLPIYTYIFQVVFSRGFSSISLISAACTTNPINLDLFSLILSATNVNYELSTTSPVPVAAPSKA